jgi:protein ImuB
MDASQQLRSLAIEVADFPAVATGRPSGTPVAVLHANRVVAVSPAARTSGVVPGLRRREAQSRCPALEIHSADVARDARAFEPALQSIEELAPRIEVVSAGRCVLPTRGPSRYHGGDRSLANLIRDRVRTALGSVAVVGVGVADGPRAAQIVAAESLRSGAPVVVGPGATATHLAPLPVAVLAAVIPSAAPTPAGTHPPSAPANGFADLLVRLGIRTVGHFAALTAPDVSARFGVVGRLAHQVATGTETVPADVVDPPADLVVATDVDPPIAQVERATFVAKVLADELADRLGVRGLVCTRVLVAIETVDGERLERLWRHEGSLTPAAVAQRVRWQLDGWRRGRVRHDDSGGVCRIELIPDQIVPDAGRQLGFWGGSDDATTRALRALARIQGQLGAGAVLVPEWHGGRAPAEQIQLVPLEAVDLSARADPPNAPWPGMIPPPAPARIWTSPRSVDLLDAAGTPVRVSGRGELSAAPQRCCVERGDWTEVDAWAGPWCSDERWWDATGHRRRARLQIVIATPAGHEAHLVTLESGSWWLEASYD